MVFEGKLAKNHKKLWAAADGITILADFTIDCAQLTAGTLKKLWFLKRKCSKTIK